MPVEIFSKEQFEAALPKKTGTNEPAWTCLGLHENEYAYLIVVSKANNVGIHVRSSVASNGKSAECGEDSIRAWIVDVDTGKPLGGKISRWTTRMPGWGKRLWNPDAPKDKDKGVLWHLREMARKVVPCPSCGKERVKVFKVKKDGPNHGRPFRTCKAGGEGCGFFEWLDEEAAPTEAKPATVPAPQPKVEDNALPNPCPQCGGVLKRWTVKKEGPNHGRPFLTCQGKEGEGCGHFEWLDQPAKQEARIVEVDILVPVRLKVKVLPNGERQIQTILHVGQPDLRQTDKLYDNFDAAMDAGVEAVEIK